MIIGTSQVEITPKPGVELSGFAARIQPSTGVLDPLFAKALYFARQTPELLWIHCDLIGFDRAIVQSFRRWAAKELGLKENQVVLSATHTHAGPCTIHLREAGEYDSAYVEFLMSRLREAASQAVARTVKCDLVSVEGRLNLAVDRRKTASSHNDPRVAALGFRRADGTFAAAVMNYAIHPVALGPNNRMISADISGQAALELSRQLPGNPVVLMTNGACANLNPPAENVSYTQVEQWGFQIAHSVSDLLRCADSMPDRSVNTSTRIVPLPLDVLDAEGINQFASNALRDARHLAQWGDKYRRVVAHWSATVLKNGQEHGSRYHEAELFGMRLGNVILIGANAEVFSEFTDMLREDGGSKVYLLGYANGDVGYLPTSAAYAEGGYEVDVAHMFYGGFRPKRGGLEILAAAAANLVSELASNGNGSPREKDLHVPKRSAGAMASEAGQ